MFFTGLASDLQGIDKKIHRPTKLISQGKQVGYFYDKHGRVKTKTITPVDKDGEPLKQSSQSIVGYLESLQLFYTPNNELEKSINIHQQGFEVITTTTHYFYDAFGRRIGKSSSTQKSSKLNQLGQLVRFPSNLSSLNTTDRPQRNNTLMLWDGNRQIQEYTDEKIFTTVYEQGSFEPVARIVQLANHIEQKRLADIAYETRRFVRIGESEETINQRIQDKSQPLINIYHYHCNHLGTPQELTNQDGDVIWLSYDRAWGGSFDTIYKQQFIDNYAVKENELQPFKFQGQSLDTETGLHYNRFRYYDSDVGMFISRDPIGLLGGNNVFQYAPNPIGWIDPWGLEKKRMGVHDSGHHVPSVRKSKDRSFEISRSDKSFPTLFPIGDDPEHDHWRLHEAEREHVGPRQGDFKGTDEELFEAYKKAYSDPALKDIKVDVKSPNGKVVLGTNIKPKTAVGRIKKWLIEEGKLCTS